MIVREKTQNLRRLEAQRNQLNSKVRLLSEELSLLQEPGSYVGEVVKVMGRKKVLVKVCPAPAVPVSGPQPLATYLWPPVGAPRGQVCCGR